MTDQVSLVIITCNRRADLLHTLAIIQATQPASPVIVVDNASTDGTPQHVRRAFPQVTVIEAGENRGAAGRTLGVQQARTPYVAFNDDDSWWDAGSLGRAVELFAAYPRVACLAGQVLVGRQQALEPTCLHMRASPLPSMGLPGPAVLGFLCCGAIVRREAYLQAGGFHRRFGVGGEETLLAIDLREAGWQCVYVDNLIVHHFPSPVRDRHGRLVRQMRNELWTAWLRRPAARAAQATTHHLRHLPGSVQVRVLAQALGGLPWTLRERSVISASLEHELRLLEVAGDSAGSARS